MARHSSLPDGCAFLWKEPPKRGEGKFRRISWEEAVEKIADATRSARRKYGPGSRFVINASGVSSAVRGDQFMKNLLACDGGDILHSIIITAQPAQPIRRHIFTENCRPATTNPHIWIQSR